MTAIVDWYEMIVATLPLPLLEVLGRFSYIVGLAPAIGGVGAVLLYRRPLPGFLRLRQLYVPDRRPLGVRPGPAEHPLVQLCVALVGKPADMAPYGTDASELQTMAPCIVLGPGDIAQAHTPTDRAGSHRRPRRGSAAVHADSRAFSDWADRQ
jgi:hypothetical protein